MEYHNILDGIKRNNRMIMMDNMIIVFMIGLVILIMLYLVQWYIDKQLKRRENE